MASIASRHRIVSPGVARVLRGKVAKVRLEGPVLDGGTCAGRQLTELRGRRCGRTLTILKASAVRRRLRSQAASKATVVIGQFGKCCSRLVGRFREPQMASPRTHRRRMV